MLQGCAIVEFESAEQAAEAINTLHLSEVRSTVLFAIDCPHVLSHVPLVHCGLGGDTLLLCRTGGREGDLCQVCRDPCKGHELANASITLPCPWSLACLRGGLSGADQGSSHVLVSSQI